MQKVILMTSVWGVSLALSLGLRRWGDLRPEPLQPSWPVVMAVMLFPPLLMGIWLILSQSGLDHGRGESFESDQESR